MAADWAPREELARRYCLWTRPNRRTQRALEELLRQIAQNAGHEGPIVAEKVKVSNNSNFGFNAETETIEDLFKAGAIDLVKVARTALQDAPSIAGLMLTAEAAVPEAPEKKAAPPSLPPDTNRSHVY
jgi:chaperonin GroEL